jgi:hypothetical protein
MASGSGSTKRRNSMRRVFPAESSRNTKAPLVSRQIVTCAAFPRAMASPEEAALRYR